MSAGKEPVKDDVRDKRRAKDTHPPRPAEGAVDYTALRKAAMKQFTKTRAHLAK